MLGLTWWLNSKESACSAGATGDASSILGLGRSLGGRHDNPLQCSCLESSMNRGVWRAIVQRVVKSQIWLKRPRHTCTHIYMSIPIPNLSQPPPPLGVHTCVLYVCVSVYALQIGSSVPFSRLYIYVLIYEIHFSFSDLLHSV